MIVAGPEGFVKGQYRKFNIKSPDTEPGDDYAMMREVLSRRFKRIADADADLATTQAAETQADDALLNPPDCQADPAVPLAETVEDESNDAPQLSDDFPSRPDLIFVDGGLGQLSVAREVLAASGVTGIQLIGVAKGPDRDAGREHFHMPGRERPIMLEAKDPVLYFVQRLRDEAHRFAIGTHRAKRSKALGANPLDEIDGIGPTRKRALLKHFGSAKAVSRAGIEDLKAVEGISAEMAHKIYDFFHDRG